MELLEVDIVCQNVMNKNVKISWIGQKCDLRWNRQLSRPPTKRTNPLVGSRRPRYRDRSLIIVNRKKNLEKKNYNGWQGSETARASDWQAEGADVDAQVGRGELSFIKMTWLLNHRSMVSYVPRILRNTNTLVSPAIWSGPPSTVTSPCRE